MRTIVNVNLTKIKNNFLEVKKETKKNIIAVVKSNAYGHGLIECGMLFASLGASMLVVATLEEAVNLRKHQVVCPILLLEKSENFLVLSSYHITVNIMTKEYLSDMIKSQLPLQGEIKIDTGLNRLGINLDDYDDIIHIINTKNRNVKITGVYTHIADERSFSNQEQLFQKVYVKTPNKEKLRFHINSSSYIKNIPSYITDIRVGLILYGITNLDIKVKPALSMLTPIYRKKKVKLGECVGYHLNGIVPRDGYLYTIPLGYADGWDKSRKTIAYKQSFLSQLGDTCMDLMMLFSLNDYEENEMIELISEKLPVKELESIYEESSYEILATLSSRLQRVYIK